jgi:membrane protease YdiL (CAAX protease family)
MRNKEHIKTILDVPLWSVGFALKTVIFFAIIPILFVLLVYLLSRVLPDMQGVLKHNVTAGGLYTLALMYYSVFVGFMIYKLKRRPNLLRELGFRSFSTLTALKYLMAYPFYYFGIILLIVAVVLGVVAVFGHSLTPEQIAPSPNTATEVHWITILLAVVIAPILEEIVFRGILLPALVSRKGWIKGSIYSSLIFSAVHGPAAPIIMIFSLYLSRMYYRTRSIIPGIILHMIHNAVVTLVILK